MKKNLLNIIVMAILIILLTSCRMPNLEVKDRIKAPSNNIPPINGKWTIEKFIDNPYKKIKTEGSSELIGKQALFHKDAVVVADQYIMEPSYKIRNVNLSDFLLYKFKTDIDYLGIDEGEAQVITILGNNQYFYEFIKYNDNKMILFSEEKFFFLKKQVEEISKEEIHRYINIEKNIKRTSSIQKLESLSSGLLLGIKTYNYDELNQVEDWEYKTIWIKSNDKSISSVYQVDNLFVPRKKGFWLVDVTRDDDNGVFTDNINATPKSIFDEEYRLLESAELFHRSIKPSILKNILYVGNDYIFTEVIDKMTNRKTLEAYNIDNLEQGLPIIFSDIVGEGDIGSLKEGAQGVLKTDVNSLFNEESFGLFRRNGYWIFKGRINYNIDGNELYEDYNIKAIPPKEIVNYDQLSIPWSIIKGQVPDAVDAFTSPNEDIIIIETRNNILIYPIEDKEILQQEIGRIKKNHSDTIVMAEWSLGRYTNLWEEEILKNNGRAIEWE